MAVPEIEISKDGLKLSYQRYLADSAAGFLVIILVLLAISNKMQIPFFDHLLESITKVSEKTKIFIFFITFLLATPLGLIINGLSWFALGWCKFYFMTLWLKFPEVWCNPFLPTEKAFRYEKLISFFGIKNANKTSTCKEAICDHLAIFCGRNVNISSLGGISIYEASEQYQNYLSIFFNDKIRLEHVTGLSQLARNISFISICCIFIGFYKLSWCPGTTLVTSHHFILLCILIAILAAIIYSLLESFRCLKILSTIHMLCIARGITHSTSNDPEELIEKIHDAYFNNCPASVYHLHLFL